MAFNRIIETEIYPQGGIGTKIKNFKQVFTIEKTDKESSNKLDLQIYNLNSDTINKIAKVKNKIILRAGYEDEGTASLFFGDIQSFSYRKDGPNKILEIIAFDGKKNIQEKNISISYSAGISKQKIFNDLIAAFGVPIVNTNFVISGSFANGFSFVGKVKDALTEILESSNKSWTIQNEQIVIISEGETVQRTGLLISPETGLIGSPELVEDSEEKTSEKQTKKRWNIKSLLFPQLFSGVLIQIKSFKVNGFFRIETISFNGDNFESDFTCDLQVVEV